MKKLLLLILPIFLASCMDKGKELKVYEIKDGELIAVTMKVTGDGLPPAPANPLQDCATIGLPGGNITCDGASCLTKCGLYRLQKTPTGKWEEIPFPATEDSKNFWYLCRCK